ncbi:hypothetical protein NDU88_000385 [Pleurodeles waltl]|uniref:Uncharacterized protein n=1 Tax=Pleurodeles waltl TaxID=8319 RepID=A0AAV7U3U4_PLEWA|nr:hypothetical protein NDU88_000385 [Pleurodeles waltl]
MNGSPVSPNRREPDGRSPGAEYSCSSRASGSRLFLSDLSALCRRACLLPCRRGLGGRERGEQAIHRWGAYRVSTAPLQISSLTHCPPGPVREARQSGRRLVGRLPPATPWPRTPRCGGLTRSGDLREPSLLFRPSSVAPPWSHRLERQRPPLHGVSGGAAQDV